LSAGNTFQAGEGGPAGLFASLQQIGAPASWFDLSEASMQASARKAGLSVFRYGRTRERAWCMTQ
jgi:hypothetical protein